MILSILIVLFTGSGVFLIMAYSFIVSVLMSDHKDHFADHLKMPKGIEINEPVYIGYRQAFDDSLLKMDNFKGADFQLYDGSESGSFEYDFWSGRLADGEIYLKAFEVTKGTALSEDDLSNSTQLHVGNPNDHIFVWKSTSRFKIYEGDHNKPYAARFELWFKPAEGTAERKLCQKVYEIVGWQD
jgi:hypothetical protein